MAVTITPMPRAYLKIKEIFRPSHPPIFDGDHTPEDIAEARALFAELDPESQRWYSKGSKIFS
jgi:hypothetical protein